jgi:hypothetical protein
MSGGYQVQEEALQTAIKHLQDLLTEAQVNDQQMQVLGYMTAPGSATETTNFQGKALSSGRSLIAQHGAFISSVQDQITKLQKTLQRYQAGEDAARYGFGN